MAVPLLLQDAIYINFVSPAALLFWHPRMQKNCFVLQMAVGPFVARAGEAVEFVFFCFLLLFISVLGGFLFLFLKVSLKETLFISSP